jgi:uncharacterized protein YkwD
MNAYRVIHSAEPLTLNSSISEIAQKWADFLALNESLQHNTVDLKAFSLGENIYYFSTTRTSTLCSGLYGEFFVIVLFCNKL